MLGPRGTALTAAVASLLGAGLLTPATTVTAAEPDTTPPQVQLDPCPEVPLGEACSRREAVWVAEETIDPSEGLAVAGVRMGDEVLTEHVYDDGTGFTPYGGWVPPTTDVGTAYDYVTETWLDGPGPHELTFYARDLAGNEASFTRSVEGPMTPDRPRDFEVVVDGRSASIIWQTDARGSHVHEHVVRLKGREPFAVDAYAFGAVYGVSTAAVRLHDLDRGRHVLRVRAVNLVGESTLGKVVFRVRR